MAIAPGDGRKPAAAGRRPAAKRSASAQDVNPVASQRELGQRLRDLRTGLGLTVQDVAAELMCSATKISRLETGARRANPRDVRDLSRLYGIGDQAKADELMELVRQAHETAWWAEYEDVFSPLLGLEQDAATITSYSMFHVPALLQTDAYARAIIRGVERRMHPDMLQQRVEARLRRQQLLERATPPRVLALIDEAVLHRQIGSPAIMQAQLDKALAHVRDQKATIQVIPFHASTHASTDSNFDFLEFGDEGRKRPVVFVEGLVSNRYYERPVEIARYREALEYLRDEALSPRDSTALITRVRDGIKT
ncbi:MAG TPA: helix-turn-helix transcriptional regulator [Streptosporangiaceae bacterium]|nr:helix-turn-helix transcriptional regulator [Streptosporangiaceae bacterium]